MADPKTKAPVLMVMSADRMSHRLARVAEWVTEGGKPAYPAGRVIADMLADHDAPVPFLNRIITAPGFTADGRLLDAPGYDAASGILYAPPAGLGIPPVPDKPDDGDVARARGLLLEEMLVDFPFTSDADRAAAVATLLGAFARGLIAGSTPLMMIEKPAPRTGAGLLIDSIAGVVLGRDATKTPETRNDEEWRKRITSVLLQAPTFVVLDNLRRRLDSAALAAVLTTCIWADRILGSNQFVTLYVEALWIATANNPKLSTEMVGRTVSCRMDAKVERPGERKDFRHPHLLAWVKENRADLVWSCLTLIRRWLADGSPAGREVMGGFENWCRVMGGILGSAGIPGLLSNRDQFYQRADDEGHSVKPFLAAWWKRHQTKKVPAKELLALALETIDIEGRTEHAQRIRLGQMLKGEIDRRYRLGPDLEVQVAGEPDGHDKTFKWWLDTPHTPHDTPQANAANNGDSSPPRGLAGSAGSPSRTREDRGLPGVDTTRQRFGGTVHDFQPGEIRGPRNTPQTPRGPNAYLSEANVDLDSHVEVAKWVIQSGGLRPSPAIQDVDLVFKNAAGPPLDELAKRYARERGLDDKEEIRIADRIVEMLRRRSSAYRRRAKPPLDPDDPMLDREDTPTQEVTDDDCPF